MTLRSEMADLFAELQTIPADLGFRERAVLLRNYTITGENKARQIAGTRTPTDTTLTPTPKVKDLDTLGNVQFTRLAGGVIEEGDVLVSAIPRSYTESALKDADEWVVDGAAYRLIRLIRKDTNWEAWLRRARA